MRVGNIHFYYFLFIYFFSCLIFAFCLVWRLFYTHQHTPSQPKTEFLLVYTTSKYKIYLKIRISTIYKDICTTTNRLVVGTLLHLHNMETSICVYNKMCRGKFGSIFYSHRHLIISLAHEYSLDIIFGFQTKRHV